MPSRSQSFVRFTLAAVVVLLTYRESVLASALAPLARVTAQAVVDVLRMLGVPALRDGAIVFQPGGFGYEVYFRCTGYLPCMLLVAAVVTDSASARRKAIGVLAGVPLLLGLNLARLAHLFLVGVTQPQLFPLMHSVLWESLTVLGVLGAWACWNKWAMVTVAMSEGPLGGIPHLEGSPMTTGGRDECFHNGPGPEVQCHAGRTGGGFRHRGASSAAADASGA